MTLYYILRQYKKYNSYTMIPNKCSTFSEIGSICYCIHFLGKISIYAGALKQPKVQTTAESQCLERCLKYQRKQSAILEFIDLKKQKGLQKSSLTPLFHLRGKTRPKNLRSVYHLLFHLLIEQIILQTLHMYYILDIIHIHITLKTVKCYNSKSYFLKFPIDKRANTYYSL